MTIKISQLGSAAAVVGNILLPMVSNVTGTLTTVRGNVDQLKTYVIGTLETDVANLIANAGSQNSSIASLVSNAAVQSGLIANLEANVATTISNAAVQSGLIANLEANVATVQGDITTLTANAGSQASSLTALESNAAVQSGLITELQGNVTTVQGDIVTLTANAGAQHTSITAVEANVTAIQGNVSSIQGDIVTLTANAGAQHTSIAAVEANVTILQGNIVTLTSNAATQDTLITTLQGNIATLTANAATQAGLISALGDTSAIEADITILQGNVISIESSIDTLFTNVQVNTNDITDAYIAIAAQTASISLLEANAAVQAGNIASLEANAAVQAGLIDSLGNITGLTANVTTLQGNVVSLTANVATLFANATTQLNQITAANAAIVTANVNMKGYVDGQISTLINGAPGTLDTLNEIATALGNDANLSVTLTNSVANVAANVNVLFANAGAQHGNITTLQVAVGSYAASFATLTSNAATQSVQIASAEGNITTANTNMKGYVDGQLSTTNSSITTANTNMKGYVDRITTGSATFGNLMPSALNSFFIGDAANRWQGLDVNGTATVGNLTVLNNGAVNLSLGGQLYDANLSGVFNSTILSAPVGSDATVILAAKTSNLTNLNFVELSPTDLDIGIYNVDTSSYSNWNFSNVGSIQFPDSTVQSTAYSGGNGHMIMIDTNRTDTYVEVGSADRPFKTFAAAIAAAEAMVDTTFTFVLMGCTVTEDVDFSGTSFTSITIATSCRSVISGNVSIDNNSVMSQMFFRNIEVGGTFTILGDETSEQFNSVNFYNVSFSGAVNITATNATAFYEASFFSTVAFTNLSYLYINGAQFNDDLTITADDTGTYPIPSRGINTGTGGSISIVFGAIANDINFVKGGTAAYVFQPHMMRIGRSGQTYTLPAGWTMTPHSSVLRGTWVNNGTTTMRNSSSDLAITGAARAYTGIIGGDRVVADLVPANSTGAAGDAAGSIAVGGGYLYVCTANWASPGTANIWTRTLLTTGAW